MVDALLEAGLVAGAFIFEGHSRYHWKGKILSRDDCNISAFSKPEHKDRILKLIRPIHSDECPIVAVLPLDGNECFMKWLEANLG